MVQTSFNVSSRPAFASATARQARLPLRECVGESSAVRWANPKHECRNPKQIRICSGVCLCASAVVVTGGRRGDFVEAAKALESLKQRILNGVE